MAIRSFGASLTVATKAVGGLTDISFPGVDVNMIETTDFDVTDNFKTYIGGLADAGEMTLTGNYIRADTGQTEIADHPGDTAAYVLKFSNNDQYAGSCIIGGFELSNPLDDKVTFTAKLKLSGKPTFTAGT